MARKNIAVLSFGSSQISVMIGDRGMGNAFDVKGFSQVEYAGFMDGEFLEESKLRNQLAQALTLAENQACCKINKLCVGVPAEFCAVVVKRSCIDFYKRHKVSEADITQLFDNAEVFDKDNHTVINRAPIYYSLDDGYKIIKPKGKFTEKLEGLISFALCENEFLQNIKSILNCFDFEADFFCQDLCEALYLVSPEQRDGCAILCDSGFLSTSVSTVMGDGLIGLKSFSLGTGQIIADFCEAFEIDAQQAKELLNNVSLLDKQDEIFEIETDDETKQIESGQIYEIVECRAKQLARMIDKCLSYNKDLPKFLPVMLTGDGICKIDGVLEIFKEELNRDVKIVMPSDENFEGTEYSAPLSLLDLAVKQNKQTFGMFIIKLFKRG